MNSTKKYKNSYIENGLEFFNFKLKSGDVVKSMNGEIFTLSTNGKGVLHAIGGNGHSHFRTVVEYGEKIRTNFDDSYLGLGIVYYPSKVYRTSSVPFFFETKSENLVWSRDDEPLIEEEVKELTLEEIADKFGVEVSKLRIKD